MSSSLAKQAPRLQASQGLRLATFAERGVSPPFTTPFLVGARLRLSPRGVQELVVANASGGPGVYITAWDGVQSLCSPTLHDRMLARKFEMMGAPRPEPMRRLALETAEQGVAGRAAATAAIEARAAEQAALSAMRQELRLAAIRALEQRERGWLPEQLGDEAALAARVRAGLDLIVPHVGKPADVLARALDEAAACFMRIGLGPAAAEAPTPQLIARVEALPAEIGEWPFARGDDGVLDTVLIHDACALVAALARVAMEQARQMLADVPKLLRRWVTERAEVERLAARPDWLLDGWERICLLWSIAEDTLGRPHVLHEVASLLPIMPVEAAEWAGFDIEARVEPLIRRRRMTQAEDWRADATPSDVVARNERLRALAPAGPI